MGTIYIFMKTGIPNTNTNMMDEIKIKLMRVRNECKNIKSRKKNKGEFTVIKITEINAYETF